MKSGIEILYESWKRPTSSYEGGAMTDYAYGEDSYTFKQYALIHHFTEDEIDAFEQKMLEERNQ